MGIFIASAVTFGQGFQQATGVVPPNINLEDVKIIQRLGNQIPPDATFKDQNGTTVTIGSLFRGRPVLMLAIFYRCTGVCSVEMENLASTLEKVNDLKVGKDFDVIVVGIDPIETPDLAKDKLKETLATAPKFKGTEGSWHFLTGTMPNIRAVTNKLGFFFTYDAANDIVNHPAGIMFLTPTGAVSSYILGATYTPEAFKKDIAIAQKSQIGIKSPDIFFGCIHVDPLTGKRSLVIENVLRVAGVITVLAVLLTILTLTGKAKWNQKKAGKKDPNSWYVDDETPSEP